MSRDIKILIVIQDKALLHSSPYTTKKHGYTQRQIPSQKLTISLWKCNAMYIESECDHRIRLNRNCSIATSLSQIVLYIYNETHFVVVDINVFAIYDYALLHSFVTIYHNSYFICRNWTYYYVVCFHWSLQLPLLLLQNSLTFSNVCLNVCCNFINFKYLM